MTRKKDVVLSTDFDMFKNELFAKISDITLFMKNISQKLDNNVLVNLNEELEISKEQEVKTINDCVPECATNYSPSAWKTPKNVIRKCASDSNLFQLTTKNQFLPLQTSIDQNTPDERELSNQSSPDLRQESTVIKPIINQPKRRPQVVVSNKPESNTIWSKSNVVPGTRSYSAAHIQETIILTDSMTNRINNRQLNNNLDKDQERAIIKKYPGATSAEIAHYAIHPLNAIQPFRCIVVAGTNDLRPKDNTVLEAESIVKSIISIGKTARDFGVTEINISGLVTRRDRRLNRIIPRINALLQAECLREDFTFIEQDDITYAHLNDDGLHLNHYGSSIMKMNLLRCFLSFNPYFNDFLYVYENAL